MFTILQINWSDLQYTIDDLGRAVYSFPVHIRALLVITLIFVIIILILLAVVLGSRIFKTGRARKRNELHEQYQKVFKVLLFEDRIVPTKIQGYFNPVDLRIKFNREIIQQEIIHLHENFRGETAERLEEIYIQLNLHFDSIAKLKDKRWYIIAKGMRELALMNVKNSLPHFTPFLNNPNDVLRMEARISIMKLSDKNPLAFLSHEKTHLSAWDTANIYSMLAKLPEKMIPDFSEWLDSPNKDVVIFCIDMIGRFRQQTSTVKLIQQLDSKDERIRLAVIRSLKSLNESKAEIKMIEIYPNENITLKKEILKALEVLGSAQSAGFLERILKQKPSDLPLAIQAVRSLLSLGHTGAGIVEKLFSESDANMQLIINHAKDKRL